jgi:MFS family permease
MAEPRAFKRHGARREPIVRDMPAGQTNRSWRAHAGLVFSLAMICGLIYGSTLTSLGQFLEPIRAEFGWSSGQASTIVSAFLLTSSLSPLLAGALIDRLSPRWVMLAGVVLASAGFAAAGATSSRAGVVLALAVGGAGVGASTLVPAISVAGRKIPELLGLFSGILMAATSAGCAILPSMTGYAIAALGWRSAMVVIGGFVAVTCIPLILKFIPDAERAPAGSTPHPAIASSEDAAGYFSIGGLIAIQLLFGLGFMGLFMFFIPFLVGQGYSPTEAGALFGLMNIAVVPGALAIGWLSDRMSAISLLTVGLLANGAVVFLLHFAIGPSKSFYSAAAFAFCSGVTQGVPAQLVPVLIARIAGPRRCGAFNGVSSLCSGMASSAGPALTGFIYDRTGSYVAAFEIGAGLILGAAVVAALLHRHAPVEPAAAAKPSWAAPPKINEVENVGLDA